MAKNMKRRFDSKHRALKTGEVERPDGFYMYRWTDRAGKRHSIVADSLEKLRKMETESATNHLEGIRSEAAAITVNDVFRVWCRTKRGLKDNTFQNYRYMYNQFVAPDFGKNRVQKLKKSDVKQFYNLLIDERGLKVNTVDCIHTVLHQVLQFACEDRYCRTNVADNVLKELKKAHNFGESKRKALTIPEQQLFQRFLERENTPYHHWHSIFTVMMNTGMRVGEITGLRWEDIDLEAGVIDVNHTLVYYNHAQNGCYFNIHTPKTEAGKRQIPMLDIVKEAFIKEKSYQAYNGIRCNAVVDGYTDFIFVNRFGGVQHQGTLNKALRRIIRDCNDAELGKNPKTKVLLPRFSCHSLRHTFTTRMVESGINLKVVQDVLGHKSITTTLDIYTDVTRELASREFENLDQKLKANFDSIRTSPESTEETGENRT